jgi:hypothetical protein
MSNKDHQEVLSASDYAHLLGTEGAVLNWDPEYEGPFIRANAKSWINFCAILRDREKVNASRVIGQVVINFPSKDGKSRHIFTHASAQAVLQEIYNLVPGGATEIRELPKAARNDTTEVDEGWEKSNVLLAFINKQFIEAHAVHKDDLDHDFLDALRAAARHIGSHRITIVQKQSKKAKNV